MKHVLITAALTSTLLFAPLGLEAGTKPRPPAPHPVAEALPSQTEPYCQRLGAYAYTVAMARDAGTPLVRVLLSTQQGQADPNSRAILEDMARNIYDYPAVPPLQVRQVAERVCVLQTTAPAPASDANVRY